MSEFDDWAAKNYELAEYLIIAIGENVLRQKVATAGGSLSLWTITAIAARLGVEVAGSLLSIWIDDESGMMNWIYASDMMYDWGPLGEVPVVGALLNLFPNPAGVAQLAWETTELIDDSLGMRALKTVAEWHATNALHTVYEGYQKYLGSRKYTL